MGIFIALSISIFLTAVIGVQAAPKNASLPSIVGVDKEFIITHQEKLAFDKFKRLVQPHLFREELKINIFLLRWLRAKNLNVDVAVRDMIALKNFYHESNIANMTNEEWRDFEQDMPFHIDTHDRDGRPVGYVWLREGWDIRAAVLQGKRRRFERYLIKCTFDLMMKVRDAHYKNPNVTQFVILANMDGNSVIQQGCPDCIQSLLSLVTIYERFLPGFSREIIVVEAPTLWRVAYEVARPFISQHTQNVLKMFVTNRGQWMPYVHSRIDPRELPECFGGSRNDDDNEKPDKHA